MHDTIHPRDNARAQTGTSALSPTGAPSARGRGEALTALDAIERDRPALVRFARRYSASREDAEDAVQAACLIALRRPDVTGPTARRWLMAVIRSEARRGRRAAARSTAAIDVMLGARAADVYEQVDALLDLRAALTICRPDERRALAGRVAGYSYREIAAREDWTYTKANRAISEGRARLRALVAA